jgi:NO-binding membrane sensor protein with MHYT domain
VLLESIYYLFNLPFIFYLFMGGSSSTASLGAALSYAGQLLIVTPIFLKLYLTLRKTGFELAQAARWIALAIVAFTFGLWVKHFALSLYALPPFSLGDAVFAVGFVNSAVTLLAAGLMMIAAFWPVIKKNGTYRRILFGVALILMGVYAAVFLCACVLSPIYAVWVKLVDFWIIIMPILGVGVLLKK